MTLFQRIKSILGAFLMIISSILIIFLPSVGFVYVVIILSISLVLYGIRTLVYYRTMARHMVGGRGILYIGVIILDLGIFTLTIVDNPTSFVVAYLLTIHLFAGLVGILRALESKRISAPSWKFKLSTGIVNIVVAIAAFVFGTVHRSLEVLSIIYGLGLFYSAITRIITAFRKTAVAYIQ